MQRKIILLCGYAQVGKDTLATLLAPEFRRVAFADELKRDLKPLLRRAGKDPNDPKTKEFVRPLLVEYGKTMRLFDRSYWVKRLVASTRVKMMSPERPWAVSDCRYVSECQWGVDENQALLVYIKRPGIGPACAEERDSIADVLHLYSPSEIHNSREPAYMLEQIRPLIQLHFLNRE